MFDVRKATEQDATGIRDLFIATYGKNYPCHLSKFSHGTCREIKKNK